MAKHDATTDYFYTYMHTNVIIEESANITKYNVMYIRVIELC